MLTPEQRLSPHHFERKGITERLGTRADNQLDSGYRATQMLDFYDCPPESRKSQTRPAWPGGCCPTPPTTCNAPGFSRFKPLRRTPQ